MATLLFIFFSLKNIYTSYQKDLLKTNINQINQTIIEKTTQYLMPATLLVESSSKLAAAGVLNLNNKRQIERYLISQLEIFPQLSKFYHALPNGEFIMAYRNTKRGYSTKTIAAGSGISTTKQYNALGHLIDSKKEPNNFDPRKRDWYIGAKTSEIFYWTDLYIFFTGKQPGITAAYSILDKSEQFLGVFGVDITLSQISDFLSSQKKLYNATLLILNDLDQVVAQPGNVGFNTLNNGSLEPLSIKQLNNPLIQAAITTQQSAGSDRFQMQENRKSYLVSFVNFPDYFGKKWRILTIVPENQIVSSFVNFQLNLPLLILIFSVLALLISWMLTYHISKPLKLLTFDIERLVYGNVESKSKQSFIKEIDNLQFHYQEFKDSYKNRT